MFNTIRNPKAQLKDPCDSLIGKQISLELAPREPAR